MRSSKSRSRNKNRNNRPQGGNIVNRVFDSSGPEGKVRGTPQQIIDKYNQLARDAQLSGDRVAVENFQQHAEHYTRMLATAQKEIEARQQQGGHQGNQQNAQNQGGQQNGGHQGGQGGPNQGGQQSQGGQRNDGQRNDGQGDREGGRNRRRDRGDRQPDAAPSDVIDTGDAESGLVETPEAGAEAPLAEDAADDAQPRPRGRTRAKAEPVEGEEPRSDKPKRTRTRRKAPAEGEAPAPDAQPSEDA